VTLRFGTDGVRGVADTELTDDLVVALGRAAARVLPAERFVVGRDTRVSGPRIEAALARGLAAEGVAVDLLGVAPTPAVAWLSAADDHPAAMISASHNPAPDNGVKLFAAGGRKLSDEVEARLEAELDALLGETVAEAPPGAVGGVHGEVGRWSAAVEASLDGRRLDGLRLVIDCAHGAASEVAGPVLRRLGAEVEVLHDHPDGTNINEGSGSTHPEALQARVRESGADAGLAFDGDADRVLAVDATGALVSGDHLIGICAIDRHERGRLTHDTVVVTVMTNLGFRLGMAERGINVVDTQVGDRYVLEALEEGGWSLGGEQSGHIIFRDLATTGDGVLTGVQVLDVMGRTGRPLAELAAAAMTQLPQVLHNVRVARRDPALIEHLAADIEVIEAELGARGRVLVRPSGTEPVVRVMVEAETAEQADAAALRLVDAVHVHAG
jgi:phosphoglucosamine mutase